MGRSETDVVGGRSVTHDTADPNRLEFHDLVEGRGFGLRPRETSTHYDQHVTLEQMVLFHIIQHGSKTVGGNGLSLMFVGELDTPKKGVGRGAEQIISSGSMVE